MGSRRAPPPLSLPRTPVSRGSRWARRETGQQGGVGVRSVCGRALPLAARGLERGRRLGGRGYARVEQHHDQAHDQADHHPQHQLVCRRTARHAPQDPGGGEAVGSGDPGFDGSDV
eukprot:1101510-Prymnesium_polylepis.1